MSLSRSISVVSLMTFISRILGFVRDMLIAHTFGAGVGIDAFLVAFKIPNFMRRLFAEGAFSQAFVPVLTDYREQHGEQAVRSFLAVIFGNLLVVLLVITIIAVAISPLLIRLFAPGFAVNGPRFQLASEMLRLTFPYLLLISLTAMAGATLNVYQRFAIPAITPVLLNIALIIAVCVATLYFQQPVMALAWAVLLAGIAQWLFQWPFLAKEKLLVRPRIDWRQPGVRRVLTLMVPALVGVSVAQINLLVDTIFASLLPIGSVSWLYYSDRLTNFPLGIFGVGVATVILPHLSKQQSCNDPQAFSRALDWAVRMILLIAIPAAIGLAYLAGPLLVTLFAYGHFTTHDVLQTRLSLMAFALGVPGFMLIKSFASAFYARQLIHIPVKIAIVAMLSNIVLCLLLIHPLAHAGLALSSSLSGMINAGCLAYLLLKQRHWHYQPGWWRYAWQLSVANVLLFLWLFCVTANLSQWLVWHWSSRALHLAIIIIGAMLNYVAGLWLSRFSWRAIRSPK